MPTLIISRYAPNFLLLAWPTNFSGYVLQQNTDLRTTNWTTATEPVNSAGANYQATILTTNGPRFFRLLHP